jgi:uncharacterized protein (DUF433 family)
MLQVQNHKIPIEEDSHGKLHVAGSGVSVASVIWHYEQGDTAEDIVRSFPTLDLGDVHLVIGYYLRHQKEVRAHLEDEQREADLLRKKIEAELPADDLRERVIRERRKRGDA